MIEQNWNRTFEKFNFKLLKRVTLSVDPASVEDCIDDFTLLINNKRKEEPNSKFLVLHIGVNVNIINKHIEFERFCFNSKNFDENGELDDDEEPILAFLNMDEQLECKFDLEKCVELSNNYNSMCHINYDPGRYLCNYVYFRSNFYLANKMDTHSLFLHIPNNFDDLTLNMHTVNQFLLNYSTLFHKKLFYSK